MKTIESLIDVKLVARQVPHRPSDFTACEGHYILNEQGEPVAEPDLFVWAEWLEAAQKTGARTLAETTVGPYWVSTVFLALDHSYNRDGPPVLWETMIFGMDEEYEDLDGKRRRSRKSLDQIRYCSKAEALAGHAKAVKRAESLPHLCDTST